MQSSTVAADPALQRVLSATTAAVGVVRGGAVAGQRIAKLTADLEAVRRAQAQLELVALQLVREVDLSGSHVDDGALTTQSWLRQTVRMSRSEASTAVRTARGLGSGSLDATSAALAAGEIDPAHARLIAKGSVDAPVGAVGLIEPLALAAARESAPGQVAEVMRGFAHALDPDAADEAAVRRYDQRGLSAATTLGGMVAGRFLLDPAAGSALLTAIDAGPRWSPATDAPRRSAAQTGSARWCATSSQRATRPERRARTRTSSSPPAARRARRSRRPTAPACRGSVWFPTRRRSGSPATHR